MYELIFDFRHHLLSGMHIQVLAYTCLHEFTIWYNPTFSQEIPTSKHHSKLQVSSLQNPVSLPILDTLQKTKFFAGDRRYSHWYQKTS